MMKPTNIYTLNIGALAAANLTVEGEYFKILNSTGPVDVVSDFGALRGLIAGQGLQKTPFKRLLITDASGAENTVRVLISDENFIDGLTGNVNLSKSVVPTSTLFSNVQRTVTNASGLLIAANPGRQYLLVQNKDAVGSLFLSFGGAATLGNGVRVIPGGAYELVGICTTQAVYCIGDAAANANVVTVEG